MFPVGLLAVRKHQQVVHVTGNEIDHVVKIIIHELLIRAEAAGEPERHYFKLICSQLNRKNNQFFVLIRGHFQSVKCLNNVEFNIDLYANNPGDRLDN